MQSTEHNPDLVLVGNAELSESELRWLHQYPGPVVSADGGARWPRPGQIERIIGDGDSVPAELFPKLEVDADPNLNDLQSIEPDKLKPHRRLHYRNRVSGTTLGSQLDQLKRATQASHFTSGT